MKKLFALLTALALMLSLAACGGSQDSAPEESGTNQNESTAPQQDADTAADADLETDPAE